MHYSGGMCSKNFEFLYQYITAEDCIGPKHYGGGMYSQYINFLDPCITVEECVAKNITFLDPCITAEECTIFWTQVLQWRIV